MSNQKGATLIEAMVAAVIVGIGFTAVFSLTNASTNVLLRSIDREKGNMLSTMIMEDIVTDPTNILLYDNTNFMNLVALPSNTRERKQNKWQGRANRMFGNGNPILGDIRVINVEEIP